LKYPAIGALAALTENQSQSVTNQHASGHWRLENCTRARRHERTFAPNVRRGQLSNRSQSLTTKSLAEFRMQKRKLKNLELRLGRKIGRLDSEILKIIVLRLTSAALSPAMTGIFP
jgi:hypothetical protein